MKNPGVVAVLVGVALVVYLLLPQVSDRFFYVAFERIVMTLGVVLIVWGILYAVQRGRTTKSN